MKLTLYLFIRRIKCGLIGTGLYAFFLLMPIQVYSHGLVSTSAEVSIRPHNLVEIKLQFDLIALLNAEAENYSLPLVASLNEQDFAKLYHEVVKLFDRDLNVKLHNKDQHVNRRYPSALQVRALVQRQFIASSIQMTHVNTPYTFDDRRFYQVVFLDFKIKSPDDIEKLNIKFPKQLGNIYITYNHPQTIELHAGDVWTYAHAVKNAALGKQVNR